MSFDELTAKAAQLKQTLALIDELQTEADELKDEIKAHMGSTEEIRAGVYKISWRTVKAARFDTAAFSKAVPDMYRAFTRETSTRRFSIA
jgi:predicted phage-related endonuclease